MSRKMVKSTAVADMWGVDPKTVVRWAKDGKIPGFTTPGGHWRFWEDEMLALLRSAP